MHQPPNIEELLDALRRVWGSDYTIGVTDDGFCKATRGNRDLIAETPEVLNALIRADRELP